MVKSRNIALLIFLSFFCFISLQKAIAQSRSDSAIVVFGDTRTNHDVHRTIVKKIMLYKPLAVFHTGDLVFNGRRNSAWNIFKEIMLPILDSSCFYPSFGNHEMHSQTMCTSFKVPNNGKWYAVNIGKIHFVVIDNYSDFSKGSAQYKWLENDLASASGYKFRIVVMHLPVYTSGPHHNKIKKIRRWLVPLFEKNHVQVVFSGHVHCYEKAFSNNIYYITTGGGGAPLHPKVSNPAESRLYERVYNFCVLKLNKDNLQIQALDSNQRVIDEVNVKGGK